jgi:hypothetical protein
VAELTGAADEAAEASAERAHQRNAWKQRAKQAEARVDELSTKLAWWQHYAWRQYISSNVSHNERRASRASFVAIKEEEMEVWEATLSDEQGE